MDFVTMEGSIDNLLGSSVKELRSTPALDQCHWASNLVLKDSLFCSERIKGETMASVAV